MKSILAAIALVFACSLLQAQSVTICDLKKTSYDKFDPVDNVARDISQADIKATGMALYICNQLNVTAVAIKGEDGSWGPILPNSSVLLGPQLAGKTKYILVNNSSYKAGKITLRLTTGKKQTQIDILTKEDGAAEKDLANKRSIRCKAEKLEKMVAFTFIPQNLIDALNDPCGKKCPYPCDSILMKTIEYDFATNSIHYPAKWYSAKVGQPLQFWISRANPYLYDVTISSETENRFQESNSLLELLSAEDALKRAADKTTIQSSGGDTCALNLSDSLVKVLSDLQLELSNLRKSMSPYTDAFCLRSYMIAIRDGIDVALNRYFGSSGIRSFTQLLGYVNAHPDDFSDKAVKAMREAYAITNEANFGFFYKVPQLANVDAIIFKFNILPKEAGLALPIVKDGAIRVNARGGFKADVSSGLYYSFTMRDEAYTLRPDSVLIGTSYVKGNRILRENTGKGEFGFASFLHFYSRTGGFINVSGSIGAGLNLASDPRPRYFCGGSLLIGRDTRVVLTAGCVFGNVKRISARYTSTAGQYDLLPPAEGSVLYRQKFIGRPFISLTYSLPFVGKKQGVQEVNAAELP